MKSRNPSALSNSPLPRRAAALPNNPNRMDKPPVTLGVEIRRCSEMCQMPRSAERLSQEASMEFGWYHEFHRQVAQQSDADAFAQALEQVADAERWGLDAIWLAEIHQPGGPPGAGGP